MPWLPSRRRLLVQVWGVVTLGLCVRTFASGMLGVERGPSALAVPVQIDLNRASVGELMALPGFGRVRAESIVLWRVRHGPIRRVDDLLQVDGLGAETVAELRPFATVRTMP